MSSTAKRWDEIFCSEWRKSENVLDSVFAFLGRRTDLLDPHEANRTTETVNKLLQKHLDLKRKKVELQQEHLILDDLVKPVDENSIQECRMKKIPKDMKTLVDLLESGDARFLLSFASGAVLTFNKGPLDHVQSPLFFDLRLGRTLETCFDSWTCPGLRIYGMTKASLTRGVEIIASLPDDHFRTVSLAQERENIPLPECKGKGVNYSPLCCEHLRPFFAPNNPDRQIEFYDTTLDRRQASIIGSGTADVVFCCCKFEDEGHAFAKACLRYSRDGVRNPPRSFSFQCASMPFNETNWELFLSTLTGTSSLSFLYVDLSDVSMPSTDIHSLDIVDCFNCSARVGASLVEAMVANRGPKRLRVRFEDEDIIADIVVDTMGEEQSFAFFRALADNTRLMELTLDGCRDPRLLEILAQSLQRNKGLVRIDLGLDTLQRSTHFWTSIISSVSKHPTLRVLKLWEGKCSDEQGEAERKLHRQLTTAAVIEMLQENKRVEEIYDDDGDDPWFDMTQWRKEVEPRLAINRFREKFQSFREAGESLTRIKLLPHAMGRISWQPSLLWLFMKQNSWDVLGNSGKTSRTSKSAPPRKRQRFCSNQSISDL